MITPSPTNPLGVENGRVNTLTERYFGAAPAAMAMMAQPMATDDSVNEREMLAAMIDVHCAGLASAIWTAGQTLEGRFSAIKVAELTEWARRRTLHHIHSHD